MARRGTARDLCISTRDKDSIERTGSDCNRAVMAQCPHVHGHVSTRTYDTEFFGPEAEPSDDCSDAPTGKEDTSEASVDAV